MPERYSPKLVNIDELFGPDPNPYVEGESSIIDDISAAQNAHEVIGRAVLRARTGGDGELYDPKTGDIIITSYYERAKFYCLGGYSFPATDFDPQEPASTRLMEH